ncbi:FtsX-like permease family protein [Oculatella sp. LEGE 06141]|uniref:ABC transporter permease DevC n=1 Tax=Oculatella sp. LEGE 06141 TaxID=1828648 RepID=UPI00187E8924|nr:ABC transporter permease DevC [Oculatella sp. LEGE 06141]MBE9178960.1 FtsX-like permease family protein [Oculatella sp. LEGE 06141]
MKTPLAWLNLLHEKTRLLVAIAGVAFAVLLIFMNLGFLGALSLTATQIYSQMNAEIFLRSPQTLEISTTKSFPRERLYQIAGVEGVQQTMPVYVGYQQWRNPETRFSRAMFVYGINPRDPVFTLPELQAPEAIAALQRPNTVFIDRLSRPEFGPQTTGIETESDRRRVEIGGQFTLGGGFASDGTLIVSDQNFLRLFAPRPLNRIDLGLVKLQPGADVEAVKATVRQLLPADVTVLTQEEIIGRDRDFWIGTTSTGFIFSMGVAVSFIVGTVIVYQILYTDISDHLPEYATLKAMGYRSRYLFKIVLQEAVILAVMGYVPGLILSLGLYELTTNATSGGLPMGMTVGRVVFVLLLTVSMCALSGLISVRKVVTADPAEVFS